MSMWAWLALAILTEVTATMFLRASNGFERVGPTALVLGGYAVAFYGLSRALQEGMELGVAYAIWAGVGVAIVAVLGVVIFGDNLTRVQVFGIVFVVIGVVALELGAASTA